MSNLDMMKRRKPVLPELQLLAALFAILLMLPGCGGGGGGETSDDNEEAGTDQTPAEEPVGEEDPEEPEETGVQLLPEPERPDHPRTPEGLTVKNGFLVEKLFDTDFPTHGSWVAICAGPDNTLFVSSQYRKYQVTVDGKKQNRNRQTLFTIKPPAVDDHEDKTEVIAHPVELNGAQGLCYAFGSMYVMESGVGFTRLIDADGDGLYEGKELLRAMKGGGEHGTHAIVPTADGEGLYLVAGNMSPLPQIESSRPVKDLWDEDHVLPQNPDGRGHARGLLAPGGWILRTDPDGKEIELVSAGYRNQYDIGVHPNGEVFAYDADMEWDLGQPWYRPTRINHAVSGSEFGWRNGSGKWPAYYEDSLGAVVDIGPGSPVGVTFGTGAAFPTMYQEAMYILDWTYGTIYAVHLEADGASYTGEFEPFVMGKPLPVTDIAIADDGHMYFTAGGRRGDSALYRVSYFGVNDKAVPEIKLHNELALLRKEIEALHTSNAPAEKIDFIWRNLGHDDRYIRFAARVALEHQPIERWLEKAKAEQDAMTRIMAGLALARHRHGNSMGVLVAANPETELEQLAWTRAVAVAMYRKANIDPKTQARTYSDGHLGMRDKILAKLEGFVPTDSLPLNTEVVRLRVALNDTTVIQFALDLMNNVTTPTPPWLDIAAQNDRYGAAILKMKENPPPSVQLGIAFMLRNMTDGWTTASRTAYFSWLNRAAQSGGGNSYANALKKIHEQALATLTEREKLDLGPLTDLVTTPPPYPIVEPKGPGRKWTTAQATKLVEGKLVGRDFKRGAGLYQSALCSQCHKVDKLGADIGPQLTTVMNKFSIEDLMRATIEPSHEISDQYAMTEIKTKDGRTVVGRMIEKSDTSVVVLPDQRQPDNKVTVAVDQIASKEISSVSTMPAGLIDSMNANELRDLTAFIMSGGNKDHPFFEEETDEEAISSAK
ncbi:MAG: heme-binding protein [Planctomycetota bacterium]